MGRIRAAPGVNKSRFSSVDESAYEGLLAAYVGAWVEDIAINLLGKPIPIGRLHRFDSAARAIAGALGRYDDSLMRLAGGVLGYNAVEMWTIVFNAGLVRARASKCT